MAPAFRSEGQMDFDYDNRTGPIAQDSPFAKLLDAQRSQSTDSIPKKSEPAFKKGDYSRHAGGKAANKSAPTGTHSAFTAPSKQQGFSSPRLQNSGNPFAFSSQTPANNGDASRDLFKSPSFTTPRNVDAGSPSSGPETSPENTNADNSEITPDGTNKSVGMLASLGGAINAGRRNTLFGKSKGTPGRGEVQRGSYANAVSKRVAKRRKQASDQRIAEYYCGTDSDDESERPQRKRSRSGKDNKNNHEIDRQREHQPGPLSRLFNFIHNHPDLPHILSFYAQFLLNLFLVSAFIYIIYSFWSTIRADVDKKSEEAIADVMSQMAQCAKDYSDNRCGTADRPPAMDSICSTWKRCIDRDPRAVGRAKVSAHTFAEIFNELIEPITLKAFGFFLITAVCCFLVSNLAFGKARNVVARWQEHAAAPPAWGPPATPSRQWGGGHPGEYQGPAGPYGSPAYPYWAAHQSPSANMQTPGRHRAFDSSGLPQTPSRGRIEYH